MSIDNKKPLLLVEMPKVNKEIDVSIVSENTTNNQQIYGTDQTKSLEISNYQRRKMS